MNPQTSPERHVSDLENKLHAANVTIAGYKKAQEDFLSLAAHDLYAPARKIATLAERLGSKLQKPIGHQTEDYLERILSSANLMRSMIDQLTILSEITTAQPAWQTCDLNELVRAALKDVGATDATVSYSSLPVVEGDRPMLKELLKNLLQNSLKFAGRTSGILITITAVPVDHSEKETLSLDLGNQYVRIKFSDNGIGLNNESATEIFRPFVRLNGRSAYEGNGLGLAICKKIVEKHAGIIFANSGGDGNTCFHIIIPKKHS